MLEIFVNKRVLTLNGEKIEISKELASWLARYTKIAITFKLT